MHCCLKAFHLVSMTIKLTLMVLISAMCSLGAHCVVHQPQHAMELQDTSFPCSGNCFVLKCTNVLVHRFA